MAKDKGGHGSEKRGGGMPAEALSHSALRAIVRDPQTAARVGAPSSAEAERVLRSRYGYSNADLSGLRPGTAPGTTDTDAAIRKGMAAEMAARGAGTGEAHVHNIAAQHGVDTSHIYGPMASDVSPWTAHLGLAATKGKGF